MISIDHEPEVMLDLTERWLHLISPDHRSIFTNGMLATASNQALLADLFDVFFKHISHAAGCRCSSASLSLTITETSSASVAMTKRVQPRERCTKSRDSQNDSEPD